MVRDSTFARIEITYSGELGFPRNVDDGVLWSIHLDVAKVNPTRFNRHG
jgi:hypothetical protein